MCDVGLHHRLRPSGLRLLAFGSTRALARAGKEKVRPYRAAGSDRNRSLKVFVAGGPGLGALLTEEPAGALAAKWPISGSHMLRRCLDLVGVGELDLLDALIARAMHEPPLLIKRREGQLWDRARRRTQNEYRKDKLALRRYRRLALTPQDIEYEHLKPIWYRKASEVRRRVRKAKKERAPGDLAYRVMSPLIRRYRQERANVSELDRVPESDFDFWIYWLHSFSLAAVPQAAGFMKENEAKEREIREPVRRLIQALIDCRDGVRSCYTEAFDTKGGSGRKPDNETIAAHKRHMGIAYKILTTAGLRTRAQANELIEMRMEHLGYAKIAEIPKLAQKVSKDDYIFLCKYFIHGLLKDPVFPLPEAKRSKWVEAAPALGDKPHIWRRIILSYEKSRSPSEKRKIRSALASHLDMILSVVLLPFWCPNSSDSMGLCVRTEDVPDAPAANRRAIRKRARKITVQYFLPLSTFFLFIGSDWR